MWIRPRTVASGASAMAARRGSGVTLSFRWRRQKSTAAFTDAETAAHPSTDRVAWRGGFRTLSSGAALGRLKALATLYGAMGIAIAGGVVCYFTTFTYTLTMDPDPCLNTRLHQYASDYAVLKNRWTGSKRVVAISAAETETRPSQFAKEQIWVNCFTHRVWLYLHPTDTMVIVDATEDLRPDRFVSKEAQKRLLSPSFLQTESSLGREEADNDDGKKKGSDKLVFRVRLRPLMVRNGYQKGTLPRFERIVESSARDLLRERYHACIIAQADPTLNRAMAEELIKCGRLNGRGVTLQSVIGDATEFERSVMERAERVMGEQTIVLNHAMTIL